LYRAKTITLSLGLFLIALLGLSCLAATSIFNQQQEQDQALAQQYISTIKYRNLVIDLGNGVRTNAQITLPSIGKGPFAGVLLVPGSGAVDMNETLAKNAKPFWQMSQYLSERGFVVLRYDKRGIGANSTIIDHNLWGNTTINDLIYDAGKALNVLIHQPEVDAKRITIIGHSEGPIIAPRLALTNLTNVKNIVLMGAVAQDFLGLARFQYIDLPIEYIKQVLDKNHTGSIPIQSVLSIFQKDPAYKQVLGISSSATGDIINIDQQLKPLLERTFEKLYQNLTGGIHAKCLNPKEGCPIYFNSEINLKPVVGIIGNVSNSIGILILSGENDIQTPVQQALLLQQRLTELNHPDHMLITYPNLGHLFYPSSQWTTAMGPIQQYVLADLYSWLEAHSGLSHSYVTT
jgi:pimeloyl-ACP methyl ester carboxylesterase